MPEQPRARNERAAWAKVEVVLADGTVADVQARALLRRPRHAGRRGKRFARMELSVGKPPQQSETKGREHWSGGHGQANSIGLER